MKLETIPKEKGTTTNLVSDVAIVYCQSTDKGKGL